MEEEKDMAEEKMTEETKDMVPTKAAEVENGEERNIDLLLDIPLQISVEIGRSSILVKDLLQMGEGFVIELDKLAGEPLDLYVNSRLVARGEAVMVNEKFGVRLTDVVSPSERIEKLGRS